MKLLTKKLPALYSGENDPDPMVYAKFFDPCGSWTWYATEFDGVDIFFGLVDGFEVELGNFSLKELESVKNRIGLGIERDRYFTPCRLSVVRANIDKRRGSRPWESSPAILTRWKS